MDGVLNDATGTVHRLRSNGEMDAQSACGATRHVPGDHLQPAPVDQALDDDSVTRCGRCFDGVGGY